MRVPSKESVTVAMLVAFLVMIGIGGGVAYHLATRPRPLLFIERWPDQSVLARWMINGLSWRVEPRSSRCGNRPDEVERCT